MKPPQGTTDEEQRGKLDFLKRLNERFSRKNPDDTELEARIGAYELAYQMQAAAPEAVDFSKESDATKKMYGVDEPDTAAFGANCLLARRLVERGVRFVELYAGSGSGWDAHTDLEKNHSRHCRASDKPIAGLLAVVGFGTLWAVLLDMGWREQITFWPTLLSFILSATT